MALGATTAAGGTANAAGPGGFALIDCSLPGDQFMLSDGKANAADWTVEAVDSAGQVVMTLTAVNSEPERLPWIYRSYTVPSGTVYDGVRFTNKATGASDLIRPVTETCTQTPLKLMTADPGPGLVPIPPIRVMDTRVPTTAPAPAEVPPPVAADSVVQVKVAGYDSIPADASAVQLNIAAVQPLGVGHVRVFPCGTPRPRTSNLNYIEGETRAANVFIKPGANGMVCLYTSTATHLLVDIQGYVGAKSSPVAITPIRIADTRPGEPVDGSGLLPKRKVTDAFFSAEQLTSFSDVPADATGYVLNVTVTNSSTVGYVSVCQPDFVGSPKSSVLNFIPGRATSNLAFATFGKSVCLETTSPVDLIVDLVGYTKAYGSPQILTPELRLLDTRPENAGGSKTLDGKHAGVGRIAADTVYTLDVAGRGELGTEVPANIGAAVVNITGVRPNANGHITAYACGQKPQTSNLNIRPGEATANQSLVPVSTDGKICLYSSVATDLVVDISGFVSSIRTPARVVRLGFSQASPQDSLRVFGGRAPYTVSGFVPQPVNLKMDGDGTITYTGDPATFAHYTGTLTFSDANGVQSSVIVVVAWYPPPADVDSGIVIN